MDSHTTPSRATSVPTELVVLLEAEVKRRREGPNKMGSEFPNTSVLYWELYKMFHLASGDSIKQDSNDAHGKSI